MPNSKNNNKTKNTLSIKLKKAKKPWGGIMKTLGKIGLLITIVFSLNSYASSKDSDVEYIEGEYIVKFYEDINTLGLDQLQSIFSTTEVEKLSDNFVLIHRGEDFGKLQSFLLENDLIEYVEQNQRIRLLSYDIVSSRLPNDPSFDKLWGIDNAKNPKFDISAKEAWSLQIGSHKVTVGVMDTGIEASHPDLKDNMWFNEAEAQGTEGVDDDGNGYVDDVHGWNFINNTPDGTDDHGHGTHCAGTIGASGNNGLGVVGVNWQVSLMSLKFINKGGWGSTARAIRAIDYGIKMGAHVLSNSWSSKREGYSKALVDMIKKTKDAGILFVASAGNRYRSNNDKNPVYPAGYDIDNVISVGSMDAQGMVSAFSNVGKRAVHIFAPGSDILSTFLKGDYRVFSGTSMATPHVAGVAALLLAQNPDMSYREIKERLIQTATPVQAYKGLSVAGGLVNAHRALMDERNPISPNDSRFWKNYENVHIEVQPSDLEEKDKIVFVIPGPEDATRLAVRFSKLKLFSTSKVEVYALSKADGKEESQLVETFPWSLHRKTVSDGMEAKALKVVLHLPKKESPEFIKSRIKMSIDRIVYSTE